MRLHNEADGFTAGAAGGHADLTEGSSSEDDDEEDDADELEDSTEWLRWRRLL